jgi:hypothetical protein
MNIEKQTWKSWAIIALVCAFLEWSLFIFALIWIKFNWVALSFSILWSGWSGYCFYRLKHFKNKS